MFKMSDGTYVTQHTVGEYMKSHPEVKLLDWIGGYTSTEYRHMKGLGLGKRGRPRKQRPQIMCPTCGSEFEI